MQSFSTPATNYDILYSGNIGGVKCCQIQLFGGEEFGEWTNGKYISGY